jgi:hypothetical protein
MLVTGASSAKVQASPPMAVIHGKENQDAVLKYVLPLLRLNNLAGRIYYNAACKPGDSYPFTFPFVNVRPPSKDVSGLAAIREIFRNDQNVSVTEARPGVISITVGNVPSAILTTEIQILNLVPIEQYNYDVAIDVIENNNQVREAMRKFGVSTPIIFIDELITLPAPGLPHLPPSMKNLTFDQALDEVASTFGGVVLYGACTQPRLYTINFAGSAYFYNPK